MRARTGTAWTMAYGPAVVWVVFVIVRYRPLRGYRWALAFGLFTGVAVLALTALFLAYFPWTVERFGFKRLGAWLRRWWDEDAR